MKKIFLICLLCLFTHPLVSQARTLQLGADAVIPWRIDSPSGRLGTLAGGHAELFLSDEFAVDAQALFGVDDKGFTNKPIYFIPGATFYIPFPMFNPFARISVPILVNNGQDVGIEGSPGVLWNILAGFGIKYSVDFVYYFDAKSTVINWVDIGAVFTF